MRRQPPVRQVWQVPVRQQQHKADATNPMLWTMLNAICFLVSIIGALGAARDARANLVGYVLAVAIGSVLGGISTWAMWSVGERVGAATQPHPEPRREIYFRVLYLAALLWILIALFIVNHLTSAIIRLAR
jgi:uncharacterized membrane-anchored protein